MSSSLRLLGDWNFLAEGLVIRFTVFCGSSSSTVVGAKELLANTSSFLC